MHRGHIALALMCMTTSAVAMPPPAVAPAKVLTFKDWTVGCDNGLSCQAVALMADGLPDGSLSIVVTRAEGVNGSLMVEMAGAATKADRFRVIIDGKVADSGAITVGNETIKVNGADAMKLARAMANGRKLKLVDGLGATLGNASLAGSTAALRYIDNIQGRAGSKGAIAANGRKAATARRVALPVITVKKIAPTDQLPDVSTLVALSEGSPCAAERFGSSEDTTYSLGTGQNGPQALVMLNCGAGAYNEATGVYIGQLGNSGKWSFSPALFDNDPTLVGEAVKVPILTNSDWDSANQRISSFNKGRGLSDCGVSESYVWDGAMFRLSEAARMDECRGSLDWIPVWRAEVRLVP